jgi:predicted phage terminase large subunit-like protein
MMQRLHENDLAGLAEAEGMWTPDTPKGWDFLRLPMRYESELHCHTSIGFEDPRKESGEELLWPSYKDEEEVSQIEKDMGGKDGTTVAAQLQQRPAPAKGVIFDKDTFQHYTLATLPDSFDFVIDSWDCTFKDTDSSDYVVGQKWGMKGSKFFLLALKRGRWSFIKTLSEVESLRTDASYPKAHAVIIEDKANGSAVINVLSQKVSGFVAIQPEGGKVVRANAVTPLFEAKNVFHPHPDLAPWITLHENEMLKFPKGKNDDSVDCATQALNYLQSKATHFAAAMDAVVQGGVPWLGM